MRNNEKSRGAISVFLVIILVPCIVFSSVLIDVGRVHMSKGLANSASDLALNSLLANYDADLNEWYGIVASCQSIDEFYEASAQLFKRTLSSQKLADDEVVLLTDYYEHLIGSGREQKVADLLQMECLTEASAMVGPAQSGDGGGLNADLTNAAMVKRGMVEFMKYRGPIVIVETLIDRLKNLSDIDAALEADQNEELVNDKTNYFEAEGEFLSAAFNTYWALYDYFAESRSVGVGENNEKLVEYQQKINGYRNIYKDIHDLMISNLFNTQGLGVFTHFSIALDAYHRTFDKTSTEVHTSKETVDGETTYYITYNRIFSLLDELKNSTSDFKTTITQIGSAGSHLMGLNYGIGDNEVNEIQWWAKMISALRNGENGDLLNKLEENAIKMMKAYSKVKAIEDCTISDESLPEAYANRNWEAESRTHCNELERVHGLYLIQNLNIYPSSQETYIRIANKLETVSRQYINAINPNSLKLSVDGATRSINESLAYISGNLFNMRSNLKTMIDQLNLVINGNEGQDGVSDNDKVVSLDKLLELAENCETTLGTWSHTANNSDTTMAQDDRVEIAELQNDLLAAISRETVLELKTRLVNIKSQFEQVVNAIDSMKYGGTAIKSIMNFSTMKSCAQSVVKESEIGLYNRDLKSYSDTTFPQLFSPNGSEPVLSLSHLDDSSYNAWIDPVTKRVNTPSLFVKLHEHLQGTDKGIIDENRTEQDEAKSDGDDAAKKAKDKGRYHGGGENLSRSFSGSAEFSVFGGLLGSVVKLIRNLVNLDISDEIEDLYSTAYIMNMFTYGTYEEEGLYKLCENKTELKVPVVGKHRPDDYEQYVGAADDKGTWKSTDLTDWYNKSLTNKMLNLENNVAYDAEVEYILFGKSSNADNIKAAYGKIYGIRYALNLVSGFQNFWTVGNATSDAINTVAGIIQGATMGIIPVPLTKVVIIPILAIFETALDMDRLEAGFPVELYKLESNQWWVRVPDHNDAQSIGSLMSIFKGEFPWDNEDRGIFYSDYLTFFVYTGLKDDSGVAKAMYQRVAEVIQANMRNATGSDGYSMRNAMMFFNLSAEIKVKPLMITLPIFQDYENNLETNTDWCTFRINTTRGY